MLHDRPNILVIMMDQLAPRVLGAEGGPVLTPGIDRIYESGIVFDQAITPFPVCSPARASIETGLHPHTHGIVHNVMSEDYPAIGADGAHDRGIDASDQTAGRLLHESGYQTYHRGKWHLSDGPLPYYETWYREMQEYGKEMRDTFRVAEQEPVVMDWYGWKLPVATDPAVRGRFPQVHGRKAGSDGSNQAGGRFAEFVGKMGRLQWPQEFTYDYRVTTEVIRAIEQASRESRPFMVTCSLNNPHDPNVVPDPFYSMFESDDIELPLSYPVCEERHKESVSWHLASMLGEEGVREFLRIYHAEVALADHQVQRLLATLESCGIEEDTLVVFLGDHGDMVGGHGMIWKSTDAFYEELVRVPLVLRWPGHLSPGRDSRCVNLVDVMPTLLEAAGVGVQNPIQGHSLLATDTESWPVFSVTQRYRQHDSSTREVTSSDLLSVMIRTRTRKFISYDDGAEEFFDLENDPHELANLAYAPSFAGERTNMLHQLTTWMRQTVHPHAERFERMAGEASGRFEA